MGHLVDPIGWRRIQQLEHGGLLRAALLRASVARRTHDGGAASQEQEKGGADSLRRDDVDHPPAPAGAIGPARRLHWSDRCFNAMEKV
jgi:hypothetical protein